MKISKKEVKFRNPFVTLCWLTTIVQGVGESLVLPRPGRLVPRWVLRLNDFIITIWYFIIRYCFFKNLPLKGIYDFHNSKI